MGTKLLSSIEDLVRGREQFGFFADGFEFVTGDLMTSVAADSGASVAASDAAGGVIVITTGGTNNNEAYYKTTKELFKFALDKTAIFEARVQYAEAATDDANVALGFMSAVAADSILDDGGGPAASYSGALFFKVDGGTRWNVESSIAGTQQTAELTSVNSRDKLAKTAGGSSYQTFRIEVHCANLTEAEINFFIDGKFVYQHIVDVTSCTEMQAFVGVKAGGANSEVVNVDYISAYQVR